MTYERLPPADRMGPDDGQVGAMSSERRLALVLGGGAARALAHIGVLEVLEREGIRVASVAGSSMGGLIGALSAVGLSAEEIAIEARRFRFPRWFLLGRIVRWHEVFPSLSRILEHHTFDTLRVPLTLIAVDFEQGEQVILRTGPLLPAVRATCSIPGIMEAQRVQERWLVDGGLLNVLPVDAAWANEPDFVVAVNVGSTRRRPMPQLKWHATSIISRLGKLVANPATAKVSFEVLVRAAEILLAHQTALASAMVAPEVLIEPNLGDLGLRDFVRLDEAIDAGRSAAHQALPAIRAAFASARSNPQRPSRLTVHFDPVCRMVVHPGRKGTASVQRAATTYYFCSDSCRAWFELHPERYRDP